ncbi:MAG TPA: hypothetical protein VI485_05810 [Vicinamibacterales bacterium]|nr:hypothetical protein [Vicinamibacterales bacterium]
MDREHEVISEPMSIARCREVLGQEADGLSDREVDRIRRHADALAHVIIDMFLRQRSTSEP